MSEPASIIDLGFYGKLPTYGDFIQKRLPRDFINPWHEWLQSGMMACREKDAEGWMSYYLNCPAWSFVLSAGVCGEQAVAGVTIPSVDRVGRYFNFTMASILPANVEPAVFANSHSDWLDGIENLALSVLEEELDQDSIENLINSQAAELQWNPAPQRVFSSGDGYTRVLSDESAGVVELLPAMLHELNIKGQQAHGLWWHRGSSQVSAQLVSCKGLPAQDVYLGLMMNEDLVVTPEVSSQAPELDYLDELLSE